MTTLRQPRLRRFAQRLATTPVILVIIGAGVYALGDWHKTRDYSPHFLDRKTELVTARERLVIDQPEFRIHDIALAGLSSHRQETFKPSTDPLFVEKTRDIVGLYLDPPVKALVL